MVKPVKKSRNRAPKDEKPRWKRLSERAERGSVRLGELKRARSGRREGKAGTSHKRKEAAEKGRRRGGRENRARELKKMCRRRVQGELKTRAKTKKKE